MIVLDDVDERFVLACIENKSTAHGRRHAAVMHTGRRAKKRDFLKIANFSRTRRGLRPIRSATAVYHRGRPRNKQSIQTSLDVVLLKLKMQIFSNLVTTKLISVLVLVQVSFKKLFLSKETLHYVCLDFSCLCTDLH